MAERIFDSIDDIIKEFPPSNSQATNSGKKIVCEAISEFAPQGTQHVLERACKAVLGANDTTLASSQRVSDGVVRDSTLVCLTQRGWLSGEQTFCSVRKNEVK